MKLTNREKLLLILLGVVVCGFLYYQFVFKPEYRRIKQLKDEYSQKTTLIQQLNTSKLELEEVNEEIENIEKEMAQKKGKLVNPIRLPDILSELDSVAAKNKLSIENIGFDGGAGAVKGGSKANEDINKLTSMSITFDFSGKYSDFLNFMKYYEQHISMFITDAMEISAAGSECKGKLSFIVYSVKQDTVDFKYKATNQNKKKGNDELMGTME